MTLSPFGRSVTRRDIIIQLLNSGEHYTYREIAERAGTTVGYVAKAISNYRKYMKTIRMPDESEDLHQLEPLIEKKLGIDNTGKRLENTSTQPERGLSKHRLSPLSEIRELSIKSLTKEDRKLLWADFENKQLPEIIKSHGFLPEVVFFEYGWFLRVNGLDMRQVQRTVLGKIGESMNVLSRPSFKKENEGYQQLVAEFNSNGFLSGPQFENLLEIFRKVTHYHGKESIRDLSEEPPEGWVRPKCTRCGKPAGGILADPSEFGHIALDAFMGWHHPSVCHG
ncbi:MAG: hypothetical protein ACREBU_00715 [Nitrososphaera sp.]